MSLVKKATAVERPRPEIELLDRWLAWREASADVRTAYEWWSECAIRHRVLAVELYRVALDRERYAASILGPGGAPPRAHRALTQSHDKRE